MLLVIVKELMKSIGDEIAALQWTVPLICRNKSLPVILWWIKSYNCQEEIEVLLKNKKSKRLNFTSDIMQWCGRVV